MTNYHVEWSIEIDADTPEEAAREALKMLQDPDNTATVFMVLDEEGEWHKLDLFLIDNGYEP